MNVNDMSGINGCMPTSTAPTITRMYAKKSNAVNIAFLDSGFNVIYLWIWVCLYKFFVPVSPLILYTEISQ